MCGYDYQQQIQVRTKETYEQRSEGDAKMKGGKFRIGILAVAVMFALAVLCAEGAVKIQYQLKLEKGKKYYVRMMIKHKITQAMRGEWWSGESVIGLGYDFDVNSVDANDNVWVNYTFDWVRVCEKGSMGGVTDVVYDYNSPERDSLMSAMARIHTAYLGERFSVKLTPQALVKKVKGLKSMHKSMAKKIGEDFKDHKIQFNEEFIKEYLVRPMAIYPDEPVRVGDSWSKTVESGFFPKIAEKGAIVENMWTLQRRKKGVAIIKTNSTVELSPEGKRQLEETGKTRCNFSGKEYGEIEMEESTGQVIRSKVTRDILVQTEMEAGGAWFKGPVIKKQSVVAFEMTERKKKGAQEVNN